MSKYIEEALLLLASGMDSRIGATNPVVLDALRTITQ